MQAVPNALLLRQPSAHNPYLQALPLRDMPELAVMQLQKHPIQFQMPIRPAVAHILQQRLQQPRLPITQLSLKTHKHLAAGLKIHPARKLLKLTILQNPQRAQIAVVLARPNTRLPQVRTV